MLTIGASARIFGVSQMGVCDDEIEISAGAGQPLIGCPEEIKDERQR